MPDKCSFHEVFDLDLLRFELKTGMSVTLDLGNVHTRLGFSTPFVFEVGGRSGQVNRQTRRKTCNAAYKTTA